MLKNMMLRNQGSDLTTVDQDSLEALVVHFEELLEAQSVQIPPKILRSKLSGSVFIVVDPHKVIVAYAPKVESMVRFIERQGNVLPSQVIQDIYMQLDADSVPVAVLPRAALGLSESDAKRMLAPAVSDHIERAINEFQMTTGISAFSPIFGPNKYPVQRDLIFVLMPFTSELTAVYTSTVKPVIEDECGLVCRRADDIKSVNSVMHDIWKSICEARFVLADLTSLNANVMYELGIAHTLGKPTLIINQENDDVKFPFDLAHIRRIIYQDSAAGASKLKRELATTIRTMLEFET